MEAGNPMGTQVPQARRVEPGLMGRLEILPLSWRVALRLILGPREPQGMLGTAAAAEAEAEAMIALRLYVAIATEELVAAEAPEAAVVCRGAVAVEGVAQWASICGLHRFRLRISRCRHQRQAMGVRVAAEAWVELEAEEDRVGRLLTRATAQARVEPVALAVMAAMEAMEEAALEATVLLYSAAERALHPYLISASPRWVRAGRVVPLLGFRASRGIRPN